MTNEIELKPCPFCGHKADYQLSYHFDYGRVYCPNCGISTMDYRADFGEITKAAEVWNKRVNEKEQK